MGVLPISAPTWHSCLATDMSANLSAHMPLWYLKRGPIGWSSKISWRWSLWPHFTQTNSENTGSSIFVSALVKNQLLVPSSIWTEFVLGCVCYATAKHIPTTQGWYVKFPPTNMIEEKRENDAINRGHYLLPAHNLIGPKSRVSERCSLCLFQCLYCTQESSSNLTICTPSILLYCTNFAWPSIAFQEYKPSIVLRILTRLNAHHLFCLNGPL